MDNPLTPSKIERLINLAEDKSFTLCRRLLLNDDIIKRAANQDQLSKSVFNCESSSGILDLDRLDGFGECSSGIDNVSLSKSTAFNPGEITGRSTGADEIAQKTMDVGRHSLALEALTSQMDKQTNEIRDLLRHSIANHTSQTFECKTTDLSAAEASFMWREAPLPIQPSAETTFKESSVLNNPDTSVGTYFKSRCLEFDKILGKTDSPDRSALAAMPSITEVSSLTPIDPVPSQMPAKYTMDESLDCVPVRQARETEQISTTTANYDKLSSHTVIKENNNTYEKAVEYSQKPLEPVATSSLASLKKLAAPSTKATDLLIRNLQSSMRLVSEDTDGGAENSLSISQIADYLGKQSNISVTGMLQMNKKPIPRKQPLSELHMNRQENKKNDELQVTHLRETRRMDTASSTGTVNTVISLDQCKMSQEKEVPQVVVTKYMNTELLEYEVKSRSARSKSPLSKSPSTLSTVQENYASFKSGDSPQNTGIKSRRARSKSPLSKSQSTLSTVQDNYTSFKSGDSPQNTEKGGVNSTYIPSPNVEYRELDKSIDWHEVLQQKHLKQEKLAKVQWADIVASTANGFVGVSCAVTMTITTLTDSWITAKLQFDIQNDALTIELPRFPILLSPGKSEKFIIHITSNVEMYGSLPFTIFLKDAALESDVEQSGTLDVSFKMPIIQAMSCDGINRVAFPPISEKSSLTKSLVLISDCPVDLLLDLSVIEGSSMFTIKSVQEIKKSDVNKVLMDRQGSVEYWQDNTKGKGKQLCKLSSGNAIRVIVKFNAPRLSDLQKEEQVVTCNGAINVNLIGVNTVLRKVDLAALVGLVNLVVKLPSNKLHLSNELTNLTLCNTGSITGVWVVNFSNSTCASFPFKVVPSKFEISPGATKQVALCYTAPEDSVNEATLIFEEIASGNKTRIDIIGGTDIPKSFPIKTNLNIMSWVHSGRKELSLKNSTNKKVQIRCQVVGQGFALDLPGVESKGIICLTFGPSECRPLPIMFTPASNVPLTATLHLVYDKNSDFSRKVKLFGCASGENVRWSGLVTYGETALVRAVSRQPITLELYNKCAMPAFVCARVRFNLQYNGVASSARLEGGCRVVAGRARLALALHVEWPRVERRARDAHTAALAAVTVLTGAEVTRRRILRVLRDETTGVLDTSLLDDHLKVLADEFEGEDPNMENILADFKESKASLNELIGGLHELTAQIVLPQDFADENTIVITDDTVIEHHTLCD